MANCNSVQSCYFEETMSDFEKIILTFAQVATSSPSLIPYIGKHYTFDNEYCIGKYWAYETEQFIIDINDAYIKKDMLVDEFPEIQAYLQYISAYLMQADGYFVSNKQKLPKACLVLTNSGERVVYKLRADSRFFAVSIKYKKEILQKEIFQTIKEDQRLIKQLFLKKSNFMLKSIHKIALEIINCKHKGLSASLFMEAKALEWLSLCLEAFLNNQEPLLNKSDTFALEKTKEYIEEHFTESISLSQLQKLSTMSASKLKQSFHQQNGMNITEYIQRKRLEKAEQLLRNTTLGIQEIAALVGYQSHSRFSALCKRFYGVHPKELRKNT